MKLYGALASPYVARVDMFAKLKGIDVPIESAPGGFGSDEYRRINPIGKIPALAVDGEVIAESEVICEFLEDRYPDPPLLPSTDLGRAQSRMVGRMTDLYIAPHNSGLVRQQDPAHRDQALVDSAATEFAKGFSWLEHFMVAGPLAGGDMPSIGDCALAPFMVLLKQTVFPYFDEIADPTEAGGRLATWWDAVQSHETCRASIDEYDVALKKFLEYLMERIHQGQRGA